MNLYKSWLVLALLVLPSVSLGALYSDSFNADTSANYRVFTTPGSNGLPSSDATFAWDYSALGIPSAPHSGDGSTKGLRLRVDNLQSSYGTVVGAVSVATQNVTLPSHYTLSVDVWSNYIGGNTTGTGLASGGSNSSTGVAVGVGTSGNSLQYIVSNDGMLVEGFGDNGGGGNGAYRVYVNNVSPRPQPTNSSYYAAGTGTNSASYTDPYYSFLTPQTAPSAQTALSATQLGSTPTGVLGFAWHTFTITNDGTNVIWAVDGHTMTTVPLSALTFGGGQISLANIDGNLSANATTDGQRFNFEIFDNLTITPDPATLSLLGVGAIGLLARRRRGR